MDRGVGVAAGDLGEQAGLAVGLPGVSKVGEGKARCDAARRCRRRRGSGRATRCPGPGCCVCSTSAMRAMMRRLAGGTIQLVEDRLDHVVVVSLVRTRMELVSASAMMVTWPARLAAAVAEEGPGEAASRRRRSRRRCFPATEAPGRAAVAAAESAAGAHATASNPPPPARANPPPPPPPATTRRAANPPLPKAHRPPRLFDERLVRLVLDVWLVPLKRLLSVACTSRPGRCFRR